MPSDLVTSLDETTSNTSLEREYRSSVRILVVDDEPEIAESLSEFLARTEGYEVTVASNGQEAIALLESSLSDESSKSIDLVLLDVRMPLMSGPELLSWLRNHPELKYTRVIMLTAAAGNEEKVEALSSGADDYITKPYYPLELLARVQTILRTQQLEKQLQRQSTQLATLNRISRMATAQLSSQDVLAIAVEGVDAMLGVELAAVFLADNERFSLRCSQIHSRHDHLAVDQLADVPVNQGIIGYSFRHETGLSTNDPHRHRLFQPDIEKPESLDLRNILTAPLIVRGKAVGVLTAYNRVEGIFSDVDRGLLASLASSVSRSLEIAWLFQHLRHRQQELVESRDQLQAVIDGIRHPIYTVDSNWRLVAINKAKLDELEEIKDGVAGQICYRTFFNREKPCSHCQLASTMAGHISERWSVRWLGEDHLPREWDVSAYPIPVAGSALTQAVVVWQDRTEERRLESSLLQAGKLAAIGQLAAGVAHEINNPLTAINANAQMLQMSISPEDDKYESVELISQAGERAASVVRGLLDFARQSQYDFTSVDVNESIKQALNLVSYQFNTTGTEVVTQFAKRLPQIDASWEHLQSVWLNMFLNARDALQHVDRKRRFEIITKCDQDDKNIIVIIRDNGRGMSSSEVAHIFEPFYTTKAPGQGTGLGLATCQQVIRQHGGNIDVASVPGEGTSFIVRLPFVSA